MCVGGGGGGHTSQDRNSLLLLRSARTCALGRYKCVYVYIYIVITRTIVAMYTCITSARGLIHRLYLLSIEWDMSRWATKAAYAEDSAHALSVTSSFIAANPSDLSRGRRRRPVFQQRYALALVHLLREYNNYAAYNSSDICLLSPHRCYNASFPFFYSHLFWTRYTSERAFINVSDPRLERAEAYTASVEWRIVETQICQTTPHIYVYIYNIRHAHASTSSIT